MDQSHNRRSRDLSMSNKRRKKEASCGLLDLLPDSVAISCLARVSRLDQAALSLVSKSCRSLVASPELYKTRSMMGCAEKYLYICLSMPPDPTPRWFILRKNRAHEIPSFPSQPPEGSAVVALDWGIYVIGGLVKGKRTSGVLLLDCRSHKWHHVTSMRVARASAAVSVVYGKIYVLGGCKEDKNSSNGGEVFDPKTQTWDTLPMPMPENDLPLMHLIHDSVLIEDKVYVVDIGNINFFYSPRQCKWERGNHNSNSMNKRDWCVIDNLLYSYGNDGIIYWCEPEELGQVGMGVNWRRVRSLELQFLQEKLYESRVAHVGGVVAGVLESYMMEHSISKNLQDLLPGAKLTNFGGNILVFWDVLVGGRGHKSFEIWCAEISLLKCWRGDMWGTVEWSNAILDPLLYRSKLLAHVLRHLLYLMRVSEKPIQRRVALALALFPGG